MLGWFRFSNSPRLYEGRMVKETVMPRRKRHMSTPKYQGQAAKARTIAALITLPAMTTVLRPYLRID